MPDAGRRPRRSFVTTRPHQWWGFDNEGGCNLCAIWRPSERSDERLLGLPSFEEFAWTASLYRDREQGRVLVQKWADRHGGDVEELLVRAHLYGRRPRA
jgi:hypothetical protein